ncbi:MAG: hypothetical protein IPH52_07385 [Leptospiraceae bacterium]|nr:hypothetical protein [Leptospiraceae bacterium]
MSFAIQERQAFFEKAVPISVEAYHLLYKQGLISEKTELLEGVVIEKDIRIRFMQILGYSTLRFFMKHLRMKTQLRQEESYQ